MILAKLLTTVSGPMAMLVLFAVVKAFFQKKSTKFDTQASGCWIAFRTPDSAACCCCVR